MRRIPEGLEWKRGFASPMTSEASFQRLRALADFVILSCDCILELDLR